jgi:tRNA G18 (ribose-2'-O)-methylase SpoU
MEPGGGRDPDAAGGRHAQRESRSRIVLAYDTLKDPRDLAEVLHLAAGFGLEVHLLGKSLRPEHPKVLRKLRSWRPELADDPGRLAVKAFPDSVSWLAAAREEGLRIAATVIEGGTEPREAGGGGRIAVLFGEETRGLPRAIAVACDERWTLPLGPGGRFYTLGQATALILGRIAL